MTIGLIVRCREAGLPSAKEWRPPPLGPKESIVQSVQSVLCGEGKECQTEGGENVCRFILKSEYSHLEVDVPLDGVIESLAIRGIFADDARFALQSLCRALDARYYDSESGFEDL